MLNAQQATEDNAPGRQPLMCVCVCVCVCVCYQTVLSRKLNYLATQPPNNYHVTIQNCTDDKVGHHEANNMNEKNDMHMSANHNQVIRKLPYF